MRVGIATDHGGFGLKEELVGHLRAAGHEVEDAKNLEGVGDQVEIAIDMPAYDALSRRTRQGQSPRCPSAGTPVRPGLPRRRTEAPYFVTALSAGKIAPAPTISFTRPGSLAAAAFA